MVAVFPVVGSSRCDQSSFTGGYRRDGELGSVQGRSGVAAEVLDLLRSPETVQELVSNFVWHSSVVLFEITYHD